MLLKQGSRGSDVIKLQQALGSTLDGFFGPALLQSVKDFQSKHGITPDGIVGDATWDKLFPSSGKAQLNLAKLTGIIPASIIAQIPDTVKFGITTNLRLAHFLAQCATESGNFKATVENLNYSETGLVGVFKKYFPTPELAKSYTKQPVKIANRVYASRMGNGDEASGDGYKFRGRGYIQLTGKNNYAKFTEFIGEDCVSNPDLVAIKYPLASASFFFNTNSLWTICDRGFTPEVVTALTRRVNGGEHGLADRKKYFEQFWTLLK